MINNLFGRTRNANAQSGRIIWVDCEMTGLDVNTHTIVEIACVVTEADLTVVEQGMNVVISQSEDVLEKMNNWCKAKFPENGLLQAIRSSKTSMDHAEKEVLRYVQRHTKPGSCPLAGNSVGHDRVFLQKYMPKFAAHLHYRIIDVSSIKELVQRWYPDLFMKIPKKVETHRALEDISESIQELKWYKDNIFTAVK